MKRILLSAALICIALGAMAQKVTSPDGKMELSFALDNGRPTYTLRVDGKRWLLLPILVTSLKRRVVRRVLILIGNLRALQIKKLAEKQTSLAISP